jgi:site-specific recombinase XerD
MLADRSAISIANSETGHQVVLTGLILYRWLTEEDELTANPTAKLRPPIVPDKPVPVIPGDGLRQLLAACASKGFAARRDTAIILLLVDTGARRAELVDLHLADVDLDVLLVLGKGRRERALPYGHKAGAALDRYLRARGRHKHAGLPWLWLGLQGRLTRWAWCSCCAAAAPRRARLGYIRTSCATPSPTSGWPRAAGRPT